MGSPGRETALSRWESIEGPRPFQDRQSHSSPSAASLAAMTVKVQENESDGVTSGTQGRVAPRLPRGCRRRTERPSGPERPSPEGNGRPIASSDSRCLENGFSDASGRDRRSRSRFSAIYALAPDLHRPLSQLPDPCPRPNPDLSFHHQDHQNCRNNRYNSKRRKNHYFRVPNENPDDKRHIEQDHEHRQHTQKKPRLLLSLPAIPPALWTIHFAHSADGRHVALRAFNGWHTPNYMPDGDYCSSSPVLPKNPD